MQKRCLSFPLPFPYLMLNLACLTKQGLSKTASKSVIRHPTDLKIVEFLAAKISPIELPFQPTMLQASHSGNRITIQLDEETLTLLYHAAAHSPLLRPQLRNSAQAAVGSNGLISSS
jgi:hypothetical protein